ncbi:HAD family hydrolase [Candidatus Woesearchaeota archaeon]|nr:HAD family hydrolase [Candidatus Woesearchaeota archaeon]
MQKTKLIIFDYDGVLVDTFPLACSAYYAIFKEFNIKTNFSTEQFRDFFEVDWTKNLAVLGISEKKDIEKSELIFRSIVADSSRNVKIYSGIEQVLKQLKDKGYKLAVLSNNYEDIIKKHLKKNQVLHYFDKIADVNYGLKPDTKGILRLLDEFEIKPTEAVMIGDMDGDIIMAKNAKLKKAIGVSWGFHNHKKLKDADVIIDAPLEIINEVE